jgi:hypothetical protein
MRREEKIEEEVTSLGSFGSILQHQLYSTVKCYKASLIYLFVLKEVKGMKRENTFKLCESTAVVVAEKRCRYLSWKIKSGAGSRARARGRT